MLDGATSWLRDADDPRDGGWYARVLASALTARLPGAARSLIDVLAESITEVRDTYALTPGVSPYSTASIVRWTSDEIEALVLGDSPAVVRTTSGSVDVLTDDRLAVTAPAERQAYRDHLAAGRGFDPAFAGLIAAVQRSERAHFNRDGGFWVAEADPSAAEHALTRSWQADQITALSLMTDGASAAVTDYGLSTWSDLIAELPKQNLSTWLANVHRAETTDPDGRRWPRTKKHDDKTLLLIKRVDA